MNELKYYVCCCFCYPKLCQSELASAIRAGERTETVKEWIRRVKDVDGVLPGYGLTPLEMAINMRSGPIVQLLLEEGADANKSAMPQWTPLIRACNDGCLEIIRHLVEHGADMAARTLIGLRCLFLAVKNKHISVVSYLLDQDSCPVNYVEAGGYTVLHQVVLLNHADLTSKVINKGEDINAQTQAGETPVFVAVQHNCTNALKVLLESKADPNICRKGGESPINRATRQRNSRFVRMLVIAGAVPGQESDIDQTLLQTACLDGSLADMKLLVERGADLGADLGKRTSDGLSYLFVAAKKGHTPVVSYLLEQGSFSVDDVDVDGYTLLHHVVKLNDPDATSTLVNKGVAIDAQNQEGETPLFLATKHNSPASFKVLLKSGADPNISTVNGESALTEAVTRGRVEMVLALFNHGAESMAFDKSRQSPVNLALEVANARTQKNNPPQIIHQVVTREDSPSTLETVNEVAGAVSNVASLAKTLLGG